MSTPSKPIVRFLAFCSIFVLIVALASLSGIQRRPQTTAPNLRVAGAGLDQPIVIDGDTAKGVEGPLSGELAYPTSFDGKVSELPAIKPANKTERVELNELVESASLGRPAFLDAVDSALQTSAPIEAMPAASQSFDGLDYNTLGSGYPPDTHGDVGPNHYIQAVNTGIAIYNKSGVLQASFSFDTFMATAPSPCNIANNGDPVVLYDPMADRWLITDFAWTNNDNGPYYTCIAASKSGDPVNGGWWFYAYRADDATHNWLNDYFKLGIWPDGLYMSANLFDCINNCGQGTSFKSTAVYAINRDDLYSGAALRSVRFYMSSSYFAALPSNVRGALPPAGAPNYFTIQDPSIWAIDVFKFHVDWTNTANSTFTGPTQVAIGSYSLPPSLVAARNNDLDTLGDRLMTWNQYRNIGGVESLWVAHSVGNGTGIAAFRWYQFNVTGGVVSTTPVQYSTFAPDSTSRWIPSLAVDKDGNMAVGYSAVTASTNTSIRYAGRLASDPLNQLAQGETTLITSSGAQSNLCGGATCNRWGDYASMSVDPVDDCTFWFTTEYYAADGGNWKTRIGSFKYPACGGGGGPTPTPAPTSTPTPTPLPPSNTGFLSPSAQAAVTSGSGDNNGYEVTPGNAFGNDGVFAVDNNSGTNNNTSCTSNRKDRHVYSNYNINVPGTAVIQGIEVRLDAKVDSASNAPFLCVQLSWDGGATWTTAKSTTTLTTGEATYLLGGSADTWGRTWSVSNLSNTSFRVRIVDVASSTARDFSLDWIAVQVTYQ